MVASESVRMDEPVPRPGRVATLVVGDAVALVLFAALGRSNHGESVDLGGICVTAAPFFIGWFAAAILLRAFGDSGSAASTRPRVLIMRSAGALLVGVAIALLVRRLVFGADVPPAFVLVALVVNAVFLLGWRGVVSSLLWRM